MSADGGAAGRAGAYTLHACPEGKVPAARQKALPTVAKGNPLLGRVDRPGAYTQSTYLQWFGELATNNGTPPKVEMGDGLFPAAASAAPMVTLCDVDAAAWVCWYRDLQSLGPNYPPYYDILRTGFGATRYGGPGS